MPRNCHGKQRDHNRQREGILPVPCGKELGRTLSGAINLLNPDIIVIGGMLSQIDSFHFQQYISLGIHQYALKLLSKDVPIVKSTLGTNSTIIGACLIARERSLKRLV